MTVDYKLENKVVWTGKIPDAKKYLKALDVFTLTSRTEAMPYTILEAGIAGLPILASRVGGIPEMIDNGENGILVLPKKNDILKGLEYLFNHQDKWQLLGEKFKEKVLKDFMFETMFAKTLEVYRN
jgi:glycosyltransferase involved in cell wall biosynthesis